MMLARGRVMAARAYEGFLGADAARSGGQLPSAWFRAVTLSDYEAANLEFEVNKSRR